MPRPSNRSERRQQIVEALRRLIPRHGYPGVSVSELAEEAGLSAGLVHYHFRNKQAVLLALMRDMARDLGERADDAEAVGAPGNGRTELLAVVDSWLSLTLEPEAVGAWVAAAAEAQNQPEVREVYGAIMSEATERLRRMVFRVLQREQRERRYARAIAVAIMAIIEGYFQLAASAPEVVRPRSVLPAAHAMIAGMIDSQ